MGACNLDHSLTDVQKKLEDQKAFLPETLYGQLDEYLQRDIDQEHLNVLFHLLKKYDLAEPEEQTRRNNELNQLLTSA